MQSINDILGCRTAGLERTPHAGPLFQGVPLGHLHDGDGILRITTNGDATVQMFTFLSAVNIDNGRVKETIYISVSLRCRLFGFGYRITACIGHKV